MTEYPGCLLPEWSADDQQIVTDESSICNDKDGTGR